MIKSVTIILSPKYGLTIEEFGIARQAKNVTKCYEIFKVLRSGNIKRDKLN
jgi:hypothetical protein